MTKAKGRQRTKTKSTPKIRSLAQPARLNIPAWPVRFGSRFDKYQDVNVHVNNFPGAIQGGVDEGLNFEEEPGSIPINLEVILDISGSLVASEVTIFGIATVVYYCSAAVE